MAFEIQGLNKTFGEYKAVNDLNIRVEEGGILGMLGRNGAGKTTTIRMILDLIKPDSGQILWNNRPFSKKDLSIGYLPEERGLYPKMNVVEQLVYFGKLDGMPANLAKRHALQWLEKLEMTPHLKKKTEELSKGNQQKIQLISAILHNPEFIILDEPFSGLDPVNAEMLKNVVLELIAQRKTIIFCSHQMDSVETFCEEICIMKNGQLVLSGALSDIKKSYQYKYMTLQTEGDIEPILKEKNFNFEKVNRTFMIKVNDGEDAFSLLEDIKTKQYIRDVSIKEPSLHQIFVEKAGA
ncbi:ABC transporter ATP-binding protein [Bacillus cereus]|uniref:ABC transporter ATP-binding protein n=1 Tax=Bacillus cereus TaxID=1396 RepID=UPI0018CF6658|nr:ATP-binding cassette domain-containing protein [Bacillus cereus]MBG9716104.1 ABC transporter ATP-binding protein [Bacillus cereus]